MKKALIFILALVLLTGCGSAPASSAPPVSSSSVSEANSSEPTIDSSAENSSTSSAASTTSDDVDANIKIEAVPTLDGNVCVFITNNSNVTIGALDVQILYKDASGALIDEDSDGHDVVLPGYTVVSDMDAPDDYDTFEVTFEADAEANPKYENHSENVVIEANEGSDGIMIQITNNGDVEIREVEYIVVYYLGDDIAFMGYATDVSNVAPGKTVVKTDKTFGKEFDSFEVYLNQAHTFG